MGLLENDVFAGSALVSMYAKCGSLTKAEEVFDTLPVRNVVSWNALIAGYAQQGHGHEALHCFEKMQLEGISPDAITYICILKACGNAGAPGKGQDIHAEIVKQRLLEKHISVGNSLVDMYTKCGFIAKAQEVFDKLPLRNVVSWNVLIAGYVQHRHDREALHCYEQMKLKGFHPNTVTFICTLKACGSIGAADQGQKIHAEIVRGGFLEKDSFAGNALVDMYVKCGMLAKAHYVFDGLSVRDVVSWNALLMGYAQHMDGEEALQCFEWMQLEGISPDVVTFVCILKVCGNIGAIEKGKEVHAVMIREGVLEKHIVIGNALVFMYAKCGLLAEARAVFDKIPVRNIVMWSALITGYAQHGPAEEALECFEWMRSEGISPDAVIFVSTLKACGILGATDKGEEIHAEIVREGLLDKDVFIGNALVDMYAKCGLLGKAEAAFEKLHAPDIVAWSALISGYVQHGHNKEAVSCFEQMRIKGVSPNAVTFASVLKACSSLGAIDKGQEIHAEIMRERILEIDFVVGNSLLDMYAKCGLLAKAHEVFQNMPVRRVVSWNALIAGYAQHGRGKEALNCFEQMQREGFPADTVTFTCILKACGSIGAADRGQEIHAQIAREGLLTKDVFVGNALVDMFAKCGLLAKAREVFDGLSVRDIVSWNALITGYAQHGLAKEVLDCLKRMQCEGKSPNTVTLVCILKACGSMGAADKGEEIHAEISREGLLEKDIFLGNALVDMYAKCGLLAKAQEAFDSLPIRDVVTWNALITGYAQLGKVEDVLYSFEKMVGEGVKPDLVSFASVLNACSHTGLVDKGQMYFETMRTAYGIVPILEHHACMVDLFGRAGHLEKAIKVINDMPFTATLKMWHNVLGACRKWGNLELGRLAFGYAMQLDDKDAAAYVSMSNIFLDAGRQEEAETIEAITMR